MPRYKQYNLNKSPLYKASNKRRLCDILNVSYSDLKELLIKNNYWVYDTKNPGEKKRTIYAPKPPIKKVQKRFQILLSRIILPGYLFSGKKGYCHIDNAQYHVSSKYFIVSDIRKFYTSCKREYVFKFFRNTLKMADDVAWLLVDLVTYEDFIPTGSPTGQIIAFLSYQLTFDRINRLSKDKNVLFSLFVDDMTFSSVNPFPRNFIFSVENELKKVNLQLHSKKTKKIHPKQYKKVTGCIITPDHQLKAPNKNRLGILHDYSKILIEKNRGETKSKPFKSLRGKIQSVNQIESGLFKETYLSIS